jgi:hypothetical protein
MQGHFLFDEQLIADTIAYYKALDGRDLTPQEAERYLVSLADCWDWMIASLPPRFPEILRSGVDPVQQRGMGSAASSESSGGGSPPKAGTPELSPLLLLDN